MDRAAGTTRPRLDHSSRQRIWSHCAPGNRRTDAAGMELLPPWLLDRLLATRSSVLLRAPSTNGTRPSQAQRWFFSLFDDLWTLRNKTQHGADPVSQRQIRLAKCERAIRRLYAAATDLPYHERHPFRDSIETLLSTTLSDQELWISKTETYLPKASRRAAKRGNSQPAITAYFHRLPPAVAD